MDERRTAWLWATPAVTGILFAVFGNFLFSTSDTIAKSLTQRYPVFQVIAMQAIFASIPLTLVVWRTGGFARLRVKNPKMVLLRALTAGIGTIGGMTAISLMPLATFYSIVFCTPMVVTLASIPLLGEKVGVRRMAAVATGFAGVLVMVRPGVEPLSLGHFAAFFAVLTSATTILVIRSIGRTEERSVMVMAVLVGLLTVSVPAALMVGRPPALADVGLAFCSGCIMGTAQFMTLEAFRRAPVGTVAPMQYTMLIWALIYGVAVFGDPVQIHVVAGAVIIIASALYIMQRERVKGREIARAAAKEGATG
jgi:drug/metabolite transporter (DMT)-like permease